MTKAVDAFKKIAETQSPFHFPRRQFWARNTKEMAIWKVRRASSLQGDWYISAGAGMGEVLPCPRNSKHTRLAIAAPTWREQRKVLNFPSWSKGIRRLFNPYGVIAVDPDKNPKIQGDLANQFMLVGSPQCQCRRKLPSSERRISVSRCSSPDSDLAGVAEQADRSPLERHSGSSGCRCGVEGDRQGCPGNGLDGRRGQSHAHPGR